MSSWSFGNLSSWMVHCGIRMASFQIFISFHFFLARSLSHYRGQHEGEILLHRVQLENKHKQQTHTHTHTHTNIEKKRTFSWFLECVEWSWHWRAGSYRSRCTDYCRRAASFHCCSLFSLFFSTLHSAYRDAEARHTHEKWEAKKQEIKKRIKTTKTVT